jgi:BMFP domain-containing protein YqiC
VAGSTLSGQQMEAVQAAMMDSPAEKLSHQRTIMELKAIFEEPLKRLDAITEEEWDAAE